MKRIFDENNLQQALTAAGSHAEERFAQDYHTSDAELTNALIAQTRFADLPSVRSALQEMLTLPFHNPSQSAVILKNF